MKSATHRRFGAGAVKSRSSRSGALAALRSGMVVRTPLPRTRPLIRSSRISRSTCRFETARPCRRSIAVIFRRPHIDSGVASPFAFTRAARIASMMTASARSRLLGRARFHARYVRSATGTPCSRKTLQIDPTERC